VRLPALARDVDGSAPFNFDPDSFADLRLGIVSNDDTLTTRLAGGHEVPLTGHHTPPRFNLRGSFAFSYENGRTTPGSCQILMRPLAPESLALLGGRALHADPRVRAPDPDLDATGLAHPLNADAGVLPTGRRVRSADHIPVVSSVSRSPT
jgi:hypothetical protein